MSLHCLPRVSCREFLSAENYLELMANFVLVNSLTLSDIKTTFTNKPQIRELAFLIQRC